MDAQDLLREFQGIGYEISTDGQEVYCKYMLEGEPPKDVIPLLEDLKINKWEMVELLKTLKTPLKRIKKPIYIKSNVLGGKVTCLVADEKMTKHEGPELTYTAEEISVLLEQFYAMDTDEFADYLQKINLVKETFPGSRAVAVSHQNKRKDINMNFSQLFPSKYFSKDDLPQPKRFTIDSVEMEEIENEDGVSKKPVLRFTEEEAKPLVLNRTNGDTLSELFGEETDSWQGKQIELYVDHGVKFGTKKIGGIRVRSPKASEKN